MVNYKIRWNHGQLVGKDADYAQIKLSSGEIRIVRVECRASIGMVSNTDQKNIKLGKAGRKMARI